MNLKESFELGKKWLSKHDKIRVVSHYDTDGISSAAIILSLLKRSGRIFHLNIIDNLDEHFIETLKSRNEPTIFLDLGNSHIELVNQLDSPVLIIDHHQINGTPRENILMINPPADEMSASAVSYLFSKAMDEKNRDLAYLAILGSSGDRQPIPAEILSDAENVEISTGIRFYGRNLKPVHRMLSDSFDPIIPGIFNNEGAAVEFLEAIGVNARKGDNWRMLSDLSDIEKSNLVAGIVMRRREQEKPSDIVGEIYHIKDFGLDSTEMSTVINAFSRTGYPSRAISLCLGNKKEIEGMNSTLLEYKQKIVENINYAEQNKRKTEKLDYIFGIDYKVIGTISSLLLDDSKKGIVGFAPRRKSMKVSVRMNNDFSVGNKIHEIASSLGGSGGGHERVGGAIIPIDKAEEFIIKWENFLNEEFEE